MRLTRPLVLLPVLALTIIIAGALAYERALWTEGHSELPAHVYNHALARAKSYLHLGKNCRLPIGSINALYDCYRFESRQTYRGEVGPGSEAVNFYDERGRVKAGLISSNEWIRSFFSMVYDPYVFGRCDIKGIATDAFKVEFVGRRSAYPLDLNFGGRHIIVIEKLKSRGPCRMSPLPG